VLDKNINYYRKNKEKFKKDFAGKYIVIKHQQVIGVYETHALAYHETRQTHEVGTFIIKHIPAEV
jgi:hypothetical protein